LAQVDDFNPTSFWLVGEWDAERERIALHDLAETRLPGRPALRWEYRFEPNGAFVKEMLVADGEGGFRLASDYRYLPAQRPMATEPRTTKIARASQITCFPASTGPWSR